MKLVSFWDMNGLLTDSCDKDAKSLVDTVIDSWERYVGNAEQSDDLTLLAVTYKR